MGKLAFKKKVDAEKWEHDVLAQMNRGVFVSAKEAERTTLRELLQRYIDEYVPRLADARRTTNRALALMKRPIAQMIVASVRSSDVAAFIKERQAD